jgi:superfamily II DNA helicase RecQ
MQIKFFSIPALVPGEAEEELNRFLRTVRLLTVQREFVGDGPNSRWCLAVEYLESVGAGTDNRRTGKVRVDYKEILPPEDFALFARLRDWRKTVADREGVPVYTIFTNDQLAKIAGGRINVKSELAKLEGVGEGRVSKYGEAVLEIVKTETATQQEGEEQ